MPELLWYAAIVVAPSEPALQYPIITTVTRLFHDSILILYNSQTIINLLTAQFIERRRSPPWRRFLRVCRLIFVYWRHVNITRLLIHIHVDVIKLVVTVLAKGLTSFQNALVVSHDAQIIVDVLVSIAFANGHIKLLLSAPFKLLHVFMLSFMAKILINK